jgi:hypothetical protein
VFFSGRRLDCTGLNSCHFFLIHRISTINDIACESPCHAVNDDGCI